MAQDLKLNIDGLWTDPNPFSEVPPGALVVADNLVIDAESVAKTRRGLKQYGTLIAGAQKNFSYKDKLLLHDGTTLYYDIDDAGTWTALAGTITGSLYNAELNLNLYFTTDDGVTKLDDPAGTLQLAGAPAALDGTAVLSTAGSGWFNDLTQVAYRIVWGYRDANENLILGAPSARIIATNTSGSADTVDLEFTIPSTVTSNYFYQIYRSPLTVNATATPSDELQLVIEKDITAPEITAGIVTITDAVPDEQKGAIIYTAPTQQGILQANTRPPLARDLTRFRQHMFYANTSLAHSAVVSLLENPTLGDTITIDGTTYTAAVAESATDFLVGVSLTDTLRSLIRVTNRNHPTVQAFELNGKTVQFQAIDITDPSFTVTTSNSALFNTATSRNDTKANRVYISKLGQPEAVPLTNFIDVGRADKAILRILDVRDAVFVLKEDGVYRITGTTTENFIAEQHDSTIQILGPDTADTFEDRVICLSNKGVVSISVNGIEILSPQIEEDLLRITQLSNFAQQAWGLGYSSDRKFLLGLPSDDTDPNVVQIFVYNIKTLTWTRWPLEVVAGVVHSTNDKLYLIRADDQVIEERKNFTLDDFADDEFPVTVISASGADVTIGAGLADIEVGFTFEQGANRAVVEAIDGSVVTLSRDNLPIVAGAATVYKPISCVLEWSELAGGNPGILKHYQECTFLFEDASFESITAGFRSNISPSLSTVVLNTLDRGAWGSFPWGEVPWGEGLGGFQPLRTFFPRETARASWTNVRLELSEAFNAFSLLGASVLLTPMSSRFR